MELLAPAGSVEKLAYAYAYGADAAYIGVKNFSLRERAQEVSASDIDYLKQVKGKKRLYGAVNILMHQNDIKDLTSELETLAQLPFDAFIVSDLGAAALLKREFPERALHLSTQASCLNSEAVKAYQELGFSRIILGREASLEDLRLIRSATDDVELEVFVHGAMCMAYSGRCLLSAFMSNRSANQGDCAHTCRWEYRLLEERKREGEYFPIIEGPSYTTILSSKDLCMIDHLETLRSTGIDSVKIEGRMKSLYYVATVTRAYRKALDRDPQWQSYREDLFNVSHREYSTGFFFDQAHLTIEGQQAYIRNYLFLGSIGAEVSPGLYELNLKNPIKCGQTLEFISPHSLQREDTKFTLYDEHQQTVERLNHHQKGFIAPSFPLEPYTLLRRAQEVK